MDSPKRNTCVVARITSYNVCYTKLLRAVSRLDATCIVCDDELSPSQMRSMSEVLNTRIIDRTMLILDIFASHARSKEGNLQVELAQQRYRLTRLTGAGIAMSRLGGGIVV